MYFLVGRRPFRRHSFEVLCLLRAELEVLVRAQLTMSTERKPEEKIPAGTETRKAEQNAHVDLVLQA